VQKQKGSLLVINRGETHFIQRTCSVLPPLLLSLSRSAEGAQVAAWGWVGDGEFPL